MNQIRSAESALVLKKLENVPKEVFKKYFSLIKELGGDASGIYALYDDDQLYYVGRATDLRKRLNQHLRDRHYASWTHFSLYLIKRDEHIGEIESLLVRIANPKGNRIVPKGKSSGVFLKQLKQMIKKKQRDEFEEWFGKRGGKRKILRKTSKHPETLEGLVETKTKIYKTYKGKEHTAILTPKGTIIFKDKVYTSPTGAALAIVDRATVNGWRFWDIKDQNGDIVKLAEYKA